MTTKRLNPTTDKHAIETAAALIRAGEVVAMPTETVYGLAANAESPDAVRKIFKAKGRPQDNPLIVHIAQMSQMQRLCTAIPDAAYALARAFWPGPLTMVLPKSNAVPDEVSAGLQTVGVRMPSHPIAAALIRASGCALAAPSANLSGRPSTTTAAHVLQDMDGKIAAIVDGGACTVGVESTVLSLAGDVPRLLRPGGVTLEQLRAVLDTVEVDRALFEPIADTETVSAPGMKYRHYAPRARVMVVQGDAEKTANYIKAHRNPADGVLCFTEYAPLFSGAILKTLGSETDLDTQAQKLFDALRAFDDTEVQTIWTQCPESTGLGLAIANRIQKAAGFHMITL